MIDVTPTGIDGLDSILNGGIVTNSTVLISGNPGTGKSILGLQFIYNGVEEYGERGIYLSFEEDESDIEQAAESIGFEKWGEHVENGDIVVYDKRELLAENDFSSTIDVLLAELETAEYDRFVLDSLTMFQMFFEEEAEKRSYLLKFSDILKQSGLTSLFISEQNSFFPDAGIGLENFLTDGNIYLIQLPTDSGVNRYIWVAKMRKQDIETEVFPMNIEAGGIVVHQNASGFSMMHQSDSAF